MPPPRARSAPADLPNRGHTMGTVDTEKDKLVIYPGQFHGITTPSYVRDRAERRLAWYDKYLQK